MERRSDRRVHQKRVAYCSAGGGERKYGSEDDRRLLEGLAIGARDTSKIFTPDGVHFMGISNPIL